MARAPNTSPQTLAVLALLLSRPREWQHGLAIARETRLQSGTLYPLVIRLADNGYLEARWKPSDLPGRPPRHEYRLTAAGRALAVARLSATQAQIRSVARSSR
jgi:PadR family transcriptional regulator, regulatory protein PadR